MKKLSEDQFDDLKTTYKVLKKTMEENHMTKDTAFIRVLNYISNKICDEIV